MERCIEIATMILNDAYKKGTVDRLDYMTFDDKEIQDVRVRRLLDNLGRFDWDDYNKMWHSFRINSDGIEFVESKKRLKYSRKAKGYILLERLIMLFIVVLILWFLCVFIYDYIQ